MALVHGQTRRLDGAHAGGGVRLYPLEKPKKRVLLWRSPPSAWPIRWAMPPTVMFSPEDLRIVRDGPVMRERFPGYAALARSGPVAALKTYLGVLERNALLNRTACRGQRLCQSTTPGTGQLCRRVAHRGRAALVFWRELSAPQRRRAVYGHCRNAGEAFSLSYAGPSEPDRHALTGICLRACTGTRAEDIQRLFTSFGPHRDDMSLTLCGRELRAFGSRGGRCARRCSGMKLGEIRLIEKRDGQPPTLLLDDVFSELDVRRRSALLKSTEGVQTLITCTDRQDAADAARVDAFFARVPGGRDGKACLSPA